MEWIKVSNKLPKTKKCLAICVSEPNVMYNCAAKGWFRDTIYSCRMDGKRFIIQSHGPELPATHWMPLPNQPERLNEKDSKE
jgi:hypothetical protein